MNIGINIKKIRELKGLSQKEIISSAGLGAAMYSRIETGKTEPSLSSLEKIAKAMNVSVADLVQEEVTIVDVDSFDKSFIEKVQLIEKLNDEEKKTIFSIVDAFIGKKFLKDTLTSALSLTT